MTADPDLAVQEEADPRLLASRTSSLVFPVPAACLLRPPLLPGTAAAPPAGARAARMRWRRSRWQAPTASAASLLAVPLYQRFAAGVATTTSRCRRADVGGESQGGEEEGGDGR